MIRQPLKWHGGKRYLARWILSHFPDRDDYTHYCEPYSGGLSVLFAHDPDGKSETVNDLNYDLSNFWRVLADPLTAPEFIRIASMTPLSEEEFDSAKMIPALDDIIDASAAGPFAERITASVYRAVAFFVRYRQSRQGLGKDFATPTTRTRRGMNENVSAWLSAVDGLPEASERLRQVEIRTMDAIKFIRQYDHSRAVFYLDPPYMHATRNTTGEYGCEMTDAEHESLLDVLSELQGKFLLSGYPSDLYHRVAQQNDWRCVAKEIDNKASSKKIKETKTECLWMNFQSD